MVLGRWEHLVAAKQGGVERGEDVVCGDCLSHKERKVVCSGRASCRDMGRA